MQIKFAHQRERSTSGGDINFAVFKAKATTDSDAARAEVLADLTARARQSGLRIDQSALAFVRNGRVMYYGSKNLVAYLSNGWLPQWTHRLSI